ncbi:MAG: hypothetical protein AAGA95_03390 [Pseudomonadota bacterium]
MTLLVLLHSTVSVADQDSATGLEIAPGWELVRGHCGSCHSLRLVTQNRGDRAHWEHTIRWMQQTQNLWPIPAAQEAVLLDYLAENYGISQQFRRKPLPPELMPSAASAVR